jgi:hypothetical protein
MAAPRARHRRPVRSSAVDAYVNQGDADSLRRHTKGAAPDKVHRFGEASGTLRDAAPRWGGHA